MASTENTSSASGASSSTSAADSAEKLEVIKKASELLAQGKRNMVCGEVPKAVALFEEAVQLLVNQLGELSRGCADAYYSCGSALLELGRMETNVLGAALDGVDVEEEKDEEASEQFEKPPPDDGEERQKLRQEVVDAMAEDERDKQGDKSAKEDAKSPKVNADKSPVVNGHKSPVVNGDKSPVVNGDKSPLVNGDAKEEKEMETEEDKKAEDKGEGSDKANDKDKKENEKEADKKVDDKGESKKDETDGEEKMEESSDIDGATKEKADPSKENGDDGKQKADSGEKAEPSPESADAAPKKDEEKKDGTQKQEDGQKADLSNKTNDADGAKKDDAEKKTDSLSEKPAEEKNDVEMEEEKEDGEAGEEDDDTQDDEEGGEETAEGEESQEGDDNEEKGDDVPNFQLAWEYLDLAKVIYLKSDTKDDQLKAAECHIKLGEVSMETEQHTTAAEDLENALKIQQKLLSADDRIIAETHYQLGLAYGLGKDFQSSIKHYQHAIDVIEAKIASLNKLVEEKEVDAENKENRETDALQKYKDEIKELQELIPEMRNKIEDTREEAREMDKVKEMAKEMLGLSGSTKGFGSPSKKADPCAASSGGGDVDENGEKKPSDISSLVRKKRKPEEDIPALELKKIRQESGQGDAASEVKVSGDVAMVNGVNGTHGEDQKTDSTEPKKSGSSSVAAVEPMAT